MKPETNNTLRPRRISGTFGVHLRLLSDPLTSDEEVNMKDYMLVARFPMGDYDVPIDFLADCSLNWEYLKFPRKITRHDVITTDIVRKNFASLIALVVDPIEDRIRISREIGSIYDLDEDLLPLGLLIKPLCQN